MKILIIGCNGFIGKYYKKFSKLTNLISSSSKKNSNNIHFNIMSHDIQDVIDNHNITHTVFLSAISDPVDCLKNKKLSNLFNITMTKKNLKILIKNKIYFIFFSSEYVFSGLNGYYSEKSKTGNNLLYGTQKIKIEKFLKKQNYKNYSILRLAKTYGDEINDKSIFMTFLKDYLNNKRNFIFADDQFFSALYVKDLVKIIDIFIKKKIPGIFNVCGNQNYSRVEYLIKTAKKFNLQTCNISKTKFKKLTNIKNIPLNVTMKNKKIKKLLKFKFTNFEKYLEIIYKKYGSKF